MHPRRRTRRFLCGCPSFYGSLPFDQERPLRRSFQRLCFSIFSFRSWCSWHVDVENLAHRLKIKAKMGSYPGRAPGVRSVSKATGLEEHRRRLRQRSQRNDDPLNPFSTGPRNARAPCASVVSEDAEKHDVLPETRGELPDSSACANSRSFLRFCLGGALGAERIDQRDRQQAFVRDCLASHDALDTRSRVRARNVFSHPTRCRDRHPSRYLPLLLRFPLLFILRCHRFGFLQC